MSKKPKRIDFSSTCRTCMGSKSLTPIFDDKASVNYYASVIFIVSGVKVVKDDGLPQKLCINCIKFINNSIEFRRKSQVIETILLKAKTEILKKEQSDRNTIENSPADDQSDDEKLIKYVNKNKKYKSNENIPKLNNIKDNCFIKTETIIINTESKYTKDINNTITKIDDIKIKFAYDIKNGLHNDVELNPNSDHNDVYPIKEELNLETNDKRSYNHNDIRTKHNKIEYSHNEHINTAYNCDDDIHYNHNDTEPNHNDTGYNYQCTITNTNHSASDYINELGTNHNEEENNHNDTETTHNYLGYNHNGTGPNTNDPAYNESETNHYEVRKNHNSTEICHNNSEYNHNNTDQTKTHNDINTTAKTITETPKNMKNHRVPCKICYKDLSLRSLDVHMSKCHPDLDERKTKCELCSCYVIKNRMKRHVALHGNSFVCVYCMKEQANIEALQIHAESCVQRLKKRSDNHSAKELKECDICNKIMQKGSIRLHKRLKHAGLGPVCEHCGKKLSNKFRLSEHLRAKHGYDKHKCNLCEFQTAFKVNLKCDQCPSSFKTTVHLSVHKKTTHSTVTLCCDVCTRSFRCRHYLLKHMRNVHRITGPVVLDDK